MPATGGEPEIVRPLDAQRDEFGHYAPVFFPDGQHVAFWSGEAAAPTLAVTTLDGSTLRRLEVDATPVAATADGALVFRHDGVLKARQLDARTGSWEGPETAIADNVASATLSPAGTLAYRRIGVARRQLTWFNRRGAVLGTLGPVDAYESPAISPDDSAVAVGKGGAIWIVDVARGTQTRLTSSRDPEHWPVWSPDGRAVAYLRGEAAGPIVSHQVGDPGVQSEVLVARGGPPFDWSADGRYMSYLGSSPATLADVEVAAVREGGAAQAPRAAGFRKARAASRRTADGSRMCPTNQDDWRYSSSRSRIPRRAAPFRPAAACSRRGAPTESRPARQALRQAHQEHRGRGPLRRR